MGPDEVVPHDDLELDPLPQSPVREELVRSPSFGHEEEEKDAVS